MTKVDARDLQTNGTDDRGRIYLGTEYANKRVTDEDELATAYREASEGTEKLAGEWNEVSDEARDGLNE